MVCGTNLWIMRYEDCSGEDEGYAIFQVQLE